IGKDILTLSFLYISRNETRRAAKGWRQPFHLVLFYIFSSLHGMEGVIEWT
ncbi:hypothetical protein SAMN04487969_1651, partial [Paenibacillus algorifonticola]